MSKKYNQWIRHKIQQHGKSDDEELIDLGQHLRESFPDKIKVQREWYIVWAPDGSFIRVQERLPDYGCKYRHPDIMVFEKLEGNKMGKLLCCIEVDGYIHDTLAYSETQKRNKEYETAHISLLVLTKSKPDTNIYADSYNYVRDILDANKN